MNFFNLFKSPKNPMFVGMHYINGDFCPHSPDFSSLNPCTEAEIGLFPVADHRHVNEAVDAARVAFRKWRKVSKVQRAEYFDKLAQLIKRDAGKLARAISLETGKSINESWAEVMESLHMVQCVAATGRSPTGDVYSSELPSKDVYVIRKPRGVVAVISPWNFPLAIGSFWCAAPAIVEGNCVVHKPSEYTPMVAQMAAALYDEAGFPPGVYNLIHGMGDTGHELVKDNHVDVILFTGSAEVGQLIRAHCALTSKTCSCELGSKSAMMIFADANLDLALDVSLASAYKLSGQRCVSSGRILIHRSVFDMFAERFVRETAKYTFADPLDPDRRQDGFNNKYTLGPLINSDAVSKVLGYNSLVRQDSESKILFDGHCGNGPGYFVSPFVYKTEWGDKRYLKEEVFGPHVALVPFDDVDEAIDIYNDTEFGLSLGVVTNDYRIMRQCRDECDVGMLYLNGSSIGAESHLPFSSWKKSGWAAGAAGTYKAVTHTMAVTTNYEDKFQFAQGMK